MTSITLTATQAFQLAALGPCLFLILYLLISARQKRLVILPVLYFASLTCSFLPPLLGIIPAINTQTVRNVLVFNEHLVPVISFLFILQLILRRPPPLAYWFILALPLVGGGPLLHLSVTEEEICITDDGCIPAAQVMTLYRVMGSSFIFMLLVVFMRRMPPIRKNDTIRQQKYWLITMLILYSLLVMGIDLARVAGLLNPKEFTFVKTMVGISFLYLVTTSLFRVFSSNLGLSSPGAMAESREQLLAGQITTLLEEHKPYRTLGYNRGSMADHFHITEQHLSRVINRHFGQSFSELMNDYRVRDARMMLSETDTPITTIAFDCGFSSITSFNRVFKEASGMPPSVYRRQHKR